MKHNFTNRNFITHAFRPILLLAAILIGGATMSYGITVSGTIYDDGNSDSIINGTPISFVNTQQLWVYLINNSNVIVARSQVTSGTFSLTAGASVNYNVKLSSVQIPVTFSGIGSNMNNEWLPTAEGVTLIGDGIPDHSVAINSVVNLIINFGIDKRPEGNSATVVSPPRDPITGRVKIDSTAFTAIDLEDTSYVAGFRGRKVDLYQATGGILYYNNSVINFSSASVATFKFPFSIDSLSFLPIFSSPTTVHKFSFSVYDNAGKPELVPNDIVILFTLPVTLTSFTGFAAASDNILEWKTATETASSHFDVERSEDGKHFIAIGTVRSKAEGGNSKQPLSYEYRDYAANTTAHQPFLYRLRQNDLDGGNTYSKIVRISSQDGQSAMQVATYPNPSTGSLSLDMATGSNSDGQLSVTILSTSGALMLTRSFETISGRLSTALDLSAFPAGTYYVQLRADNAPTQVQRVVLLPH